MLQSGHSVTIIASASQVTDNDLALGHFSPVPLPDVGFLSAKNLPTWTYCESESYQKSTPRQIKHQEEAAKIFGKIPW